MKHRPGQKDPSTEKEVEGLASTISIPLHSLIDSWGVGYSAVTLGRNLEGFELSICENAAEEFTAIALSASGGAVCMGDSRGQILIWPSSPHSQTRVHRMQGGNEVGCLRFMESDSEIVAVDNLGNCERISVEGIPLASWVLRPENEIRSGIGSEVITESSSGSNVFYPPILSAAGNVAVQATSPDDTANSNTKIFVKGVYPLENRVVELCLEIQDQGFVDKYELSDYGRGLIVSFRSTRNPSESSSMRFAQIWPLLSLDGGLRRSLSYRLPCQTAIYANEGEYVVGWTNGTSSQLGKAEIFVWKSDVLVDRAINGIEAASAPSITILRQQSIILEVDVVSPTPRESSDDVVLAILSSKSADSNLEIVIWDSKLNRTALRLATKARYSETALGRLDEGSEDTNRGIGSSGVQRGSFKKSFQLMCVSPSRKLIAFYSSNRNEGYIWSTSGGDLLATINLPNNPACPLVSRLDSIQFGRSTDKILLKGRKRMVLLSQKLIVPEISEITAADEVKQGVRDRSVQSGSRRPLKQPNGFSSSMIGSRGKPNFSELQAQSEQETKEDSSIKLVCQIQDPYTRDIAELEDIDVDKSEILKSIFAKRIFPLDDLFTKYEFYAAREDGKRLKPRLSVEKNGLKNESLVVFKVKTCIYSGKAKALMPQKTNRIQLHASKRPRCFQPDFWRNRHILSRALGVLRLRRRKHALAKIKSCCLLSDANKSRISKTNAIINISLECRRQSFKEINRQGGRNTYEAPWIIDDNMPHTPIYYFNIHRDYTFRVSIMHESKKNLALSFQNFRVSVGRNLTVLASTGIESVGNNESESLVHFNKREHSLLISPSPLMGSIGENYIILNVEFDVMSINEEILEVAETEIYLLVRDSDENSPKVFSNDNRRYTNLLPWTKNRLRGNSVLLDVETTSVRK